MPCDGACCVAFPLSGHPGELVMTSDQGTLAHPGNALEWFTILSMIQPLTPREAQERRACFSVERPVGDTDQSWFSCRHWDEDTRLCGIYDQRPWMCRSYPNEGICEHGCDCKGGD